MPLPSLYQKKVPRSPLFRRSPLSRKTSGKGWKVPEEKVLALHPHSKLEQKIKRKDPPQEDQSEKLNRFAENINRKILQIERKETKPIENGRAERAA